MNILGYNLTDLIDKVNTLTKQAWSDDRYKNFSGNRIMMMNDYVIDQLFDGQRKPFTIYHDTNRASVDIERERMISFIITYDHIRSKPELKEYLDVFQNWSFSNNDESFKKLKEFSKTLRISESEVDLQLLTQLHMDTRFAFEDKEAEDVYKHEYFNHYISDEKPFYDPNIDQFNFLANQKMANFVDNRIPDWVEHYDTSMPIVQQSYSPLGPKCEDQHKLVDALCTGKKVSSYVDHNIKLLVKAMEMSMLPIPEFNYSVDDSDEIIINSRQLLCRVNAIGSQPGKPRIVFQSNDWYDIVLNPLYKFIKWICSNFDCSFSTFKVDNNSNLNSKYSVARLASSQALDLMNSHSSNSDLSSATDKLHGITQKELFLNFYDYLSQKSQEALCSIGLSRQYIDAAFDVLNNTFVYTDYSDGTIEIGIPKFGQLQGLRGSFHALHWNNMHFGLAAYLKSNHTFYEWNVSSLYNGDDAIVPNEVLKFYQEYWIQNSDNDVLSIDKSSSEDTVGALQFCKVYIKTDKQSPKMVNGLKPNQFFRIFNDPIQMNAFTSCDLFNQRLIKRCFEFAYEIKNKYSQFGILSNLVSDSITPQYKFRCERFRTATNFLLYQEIRDMFVDSCPKVIDDARYGLIDDFAPLDRARTYMIDNSSISFDQLLNLYELRKFTSIVMDDCSVMNSNSYLYQYLNSIKMDYLNLGIIPAFTGDIPYNEYLGLVAILNGSGCNDPEAFRGFNARQFIPSVYRLTYTGFSDTHIINCFLTMG